MLIKGSGPPSRGDDPKAQRGNLGCEKAPLHSSPKPPRQTFASVDSIQVGTRHRLDLGDIAGLAESIEDLGLLHPITVDQDGRLLAGARRLAAYKRLGRTEIPVNIVRTRS